MPESPESLQVAQERLYEDESLRGNLTDDQATPLLDWAASQLEAAPALEKAQDQVRSVLRLVNQAAGKQGEARQQTLSKLEELVQDLPGDAPPLPPDLAPARTQLKIPIGIRSSLAPEPTTTTPVAEAQPVAVDAPEVQPLAPSTVPEVQPTTPEVEPPTAPAAPDVDPTPETAPEVQPAPPQVQPPAPLEEPEAHHAPPPDTTTAQQPTLRLAGRILAPDNRAPTGIAAPATSATAITAQLRSPRVRPRRPRSWGYNRSYRRKS